MGRFCKTVVRMVLLFDQTYTNPQIKRCGRAAFTVQLLTSWGVRSVYAGTSFNALCSPNKRFPFFAQLCSWKWLGCFGCSSSQHAAWTQCIQLQHKKPAELQRFPKQWRATCWEATGTPKCNHCFYSSRFLKICMSDFSLGRFFLFCRYYHTDDIFLIYVFLFLLCIKQKPELLHLGHTCGTTNPVASLT